MKDKHLSNLISNTVMLYIMQIAGYIFPLFTFPYLTRVLDIEHYGMITFITATMVYFQMLIDFGFLLSATKECSEHRNNKIKLSEIFSSVVISKTILTIIGFFILIFIISSVPSFQDKKLLTILYYLSLTTTILMPDYLFRGLEKMEVITYITILGKLIYTILIFLVIKSKEDYLLVPLVALVSNLIVFIFTYKEIKKLGLNFTIVNKKTVYYTLRNSGTFFISRIASTVYSSSNIFVLGLVASNENIALFGVANTIIVMIKSLFSPIADSIYPYMLHTKNFKLVKTILAIMMPIVIIGVTVMYMLAKPIILILAGNEYFESIAMFKKMLPIILLALPSYLLGFPILGAIGKMNLANLSVIYPAIFHIISLIFLLILKKLDVNSVIILTLITETFVLLLRIYYVVKIKYKSKND